MNIFKISRHHDYPRNVLNVFDELNATQVQFMPLSVCEQWMDPDEFGDMGSTPYSKSAYAD